jgi:hypothetical protein
VYSPDVLPDAAGLAEFVRRGPRCGLAVDAERADDLRLGAEAGDLDGAFPRCGRGAAAAMSAAPEHAAAMMRARGFMRCLLGDRL